MNKGAHIGLRTGLYKGTQMGLDKGCYKGIYHFSAQYKSLYDEARKLIDSFTVVPPDWQIQNINAMMKVLVLNNMYQRMDAFWVHAAHDSTAVKNWINPSLFPLSPINSPTFTKWKGYTGNGTTSYINTNFIPSSSASWYTLNNGSHGAFVSACAGGTPAREAIAGCVDFAPNASYSTIQNFTDGLYVYVYANYNSGASPVWLSKGTGMFIGNIVSSGQEIYVDGFMKAVAATTRTHITNVMDYHCAINSGNTLDYQSHDTIGMRYFGATFTPEQIFNMTVGFQKYIDVMSFKGLGI